MKKKKHEVMVLTKQCPYKKHNYLILNMIYTVYYVNMLDFFTRNQ